MLACWHSIMFSRELYAYFWATGVSLMFYSFRSVAEWGQFTELDAQTNFGWHNVAPQTEGSSLWSFCTTEI
jgi:hypothetical protein